MRRLRFFALAVVTAAMVATGGHGADQKPFWQSREPREAARRILASMSDEDVVAQVFLLGYADTRPSEELLAWIRRRNLGGVKIFGWNADDLHVLADAVGLMQRTSAATDLGIPLFIATDQEGGWVRHVRGTTSTTPGNIALGASGLPYDAYRTAYFIGQELRAVGVNMNFAPTVDVYTNAEAHVIGPRAFSDDPELTGLLGLAYYRGMKEAGIIATAKHFPGHGNAVGDSHIVLPRIMDDMNTLWARDLLPYRMLIADGLPAILSGHLNFPRITGNDLPSSICRFFATDVLRDRMGFDGLLITDDLYMHGALAGGRDIADVSLEALKAGSDMIMLSRTPTVNDPIWLSVMAEYRSDAGFRAQIRASAERIIRTKLKYLRGPNAVPLQPDHAAIRRIPTAESQAFFFDQACRSVTLVKGQRIIPFKPRAGERVLLAGQRRHFFTHGAERYPTADTFAFSYNPFFEAIPAEMERFRQVASSYDTIIFCLANPNSLEVLQSIRGTKARVIVMSILTPVYLREVPWVDAAIAVYGWGTESFRAGFAVLAGDFAPRGVLPIRLDVGTSQ